MGRAESSARRPQSAFRGASRAALVSVSLGPLRGIVDRGGQVDFDRERVHDPRAVLFRGSATRSTIGTVRIHSVVPRRGAAAGSGRLRMTQRTIVASYEVSISTSSRHSRIVRFRVDQSAIQRAALRLRTRARPTCRAKCGTTRTAQRAHRCSGARTTSSGYCETQARDFVAKLQGMGWVCPDSAARKLGRQPPPPRQLRPPPMRRAPPTTRTSSAPARRKTQGASPGHASAALRGIRMAPPRSSASTVSLIAAVELVARITGANAARASARA